MSAAASARPRQGGRGVRALPPRETNGSGGGALRGGLGWSRRSVFRLGWRLSRSRRSLQCSRERRGLALRPFLRRRCFGPDQGPRSVTGPDELTLPVVFHDVGSRDRAVALQREDVTHPGDRLAGPAGVWSESGDDHGFSVSAPASVAVNEADIAASWSRFVAAVMSSPAASRRMRRPVTPPPRSARTFIGIRGDGGEFHVPTLPDSGAATHSRWAAPD